MTIMLAPALIGAQHPVKAGGQSLVVTDHDQRCACRAHLLEQQIEKRVLAVGIEGRGRLIRDDQFGRADQRARRRHALLLADAERAGATVRERDFEAEPIQQFLCCQLRFAARARSLPPLRRECERQHDVVDDGAVGQQVELLEDDAEMLRPKRIAGR
jgi:hypothetical protein